MCITRAGRGTPGGMICTPPSPPATLSTLYLAGCSSEAEVQGGTLSDVVPLGLGGGVRRVDGLAVSVAMPRGSVVLHPEPVEARCVPDAHRQQEDTAHNTQKGQTTSRVFRERPRARAHGRALSRLCSLSAPLCHGVSRSGFTQKSEVRGGFAPRAFYFYPAGVRENCASSDRRLGILCRCASMPL